ncbi:hypothetical protein HPT25_20355 [Bacillus sp. BRMEA1]|nr:hypothetical protein [Neobacillus endophyticus]
MMENGNISVGKPEQRIDAMDKSTGAIRFTGDFFSHGQLHTKLVTSKQAHARIKSIKLNEAWKVPGIRAIVTGEIFPYHIQLKTSISLLLQLKV